MKPEKGCAGDWIEGDRLGRDESETFIQLPRRDGLRLHIKPHFTVAHSASFLDQMFGEGTTKLASLSLRTNI